MCPQSMFKLWHYWNICYNQTSCTWQNPWSYPFLQGHRRSPAKETSLLPLQSAAPPFSPSSGSASVFVSPKLSWKSSSVGLNSSILSITCSSPTWSLVVSWSYPPWSYPAYSPSWLDCINSQKLCLLYCTECNTLVKFLYKNMGLTSIFEITISCILLGKWS